MRLRYWFVACVLSILNLSIAQAQTGASKRPFEFRSMHLDVSRHYFSVDVIKQYVDSIAAHNFNYFHWHLTDDQGWRLQIEAYPLLTEVGAWRTEDDGTKYGGFYSKEDVAEIVSYAEKQGVEIIPEIDIPGHCMAAIAAYPWLSCKQEQVEIPNKAGIFPTILCPTDTVREFVLTIMQEVCEMFPGKYVHIGGDEVPKETWRGDESVKRIKKENELKSLQQVQNFWMKEVADFLKSKGKTVIVWGEVTRSKFDKDLVVMSWRGKLAGRRAARKGNKVVMASRFYCYFDYPKTRKDKRPRFFYPYLTNKKVAKYTPYSWKLSKESNKNIIGGAGMMWTEFIPTEEKLWHQFTPRVGTLGRVLNSMK